MNKNYNQQDSNDPLTELRDLLADFSARELTEDQYTRLQHLAIESEAAWRLYIRHMFMYKALHRKQRHRTKHEMPTEQTFGHKEIDHSDKRQEESSPPSNSSIFPLLEIENELLSSSDDVCGLQKPGNTNDMGWGFLGKINFSFVPWIITIIAGALILSSVIILPFYWATRSPNPKWNVVARITKTVDCQWVQGEEWLQEGDFLAASQLLDLEVGLVEVEFSSGAKVILQGPAQLVVTGNNVSRLMHGRLTASVPEKASGFMIRIPRFEVVDLGTEFGVLVDRGIIKSTEIHVFKGLVEVETNDSVPSKTTMKLSANEAIACDGKTNRITRIAANPQEFARDLDELTGITLDLHLANSSFESPDIRTLPGFQPEHGDTDRVKIQGWKYSGVYSDGLPVKISEVLKTEPYAGYQISPYHLENRQWAVGPGATDGSQVASIELNDRKSSKGVRQAWLYQSLGTVGVADVGRRILLEADAGPRTNYGKGTGTLSVSFATHVTTERAGIHVGAQGILNVTSSKQGMKTTQAILPITTDLVGQELFVVLTAMDKKYSQYHFDNVRVSLVPNGQKKSDLTE